MAGAPLLGKFRSDPFAIIADSEVEQPLVKRDFRVNMGCTRLRESIAQRLARDAVNFVPNDRIQVPYRAFYNHTEGRGVPAREFVSHRAYGLRQIAGSERRPQVLHRLAALGDRSVADFQRLFEFILYCPRRDHLVDYLETQHKSLNGLQQGIV